MTKKDIMIKIDPTTRMVYFDNSFLGLNSENLQGNLIFCFNGDFVNGTARVDVEKGGNEYSITEVTRVNNTYVMPIKSSLLTDNTILMQLVITEGTVDSNIPIFKSKEFTMRVADSINAQTPIPAEYQTWIDTANTKLTQMDNLNITSQRVSDGVEITTTSKQGVSTTLKVNDAKINDRNAISIEAGDNILIENIQNGIKINSTGGGGGTSNYQYLTNKPKVNNVELIGNKSLSDLGIEPANNNIVKDASYVHTDNNYTSAEKTKLSGLSNYDDTEVKSDISAIEDKIPTQATSSNQLADKSFVNSSVSTNTAYYISNNGQPFTSLAELQSYSGTVTNNDYAFVTGTDEAGNTYFDRYKATVNNNTVTWAKEYRLNNSSFTANQWSAINSGATSEAIASISDKVDKVSGKGLSTNDYTTNDKNKVGSLSHETWTFTLDDDSTITKEVVLWTSQA